MNTQKTIFFYFQRLEIASILNEIKNRLNDDMQSWDAAFDDAQFLAMFHFLEK